MPTVWFMNARLISFAPHMDSKKQEILTRAIELFNDAIIVDLNFVLPEVDYVDVKYTLLDKIANFGGKFGIFAQLTGCSLLGLLNIVMIILKCVFIKRQN